jgi:hypothetical protein
MNYYPQAIFAPVPGGARIKGSIDCLIAAEANGDIDDCNKAAGDIVDELQRRFDAVVEVVRASAFDDDTLNTVDDFVYYAIMETLGHGVGLTDDLPYRWSEVDIDLARDKGGAINKAVVALVAWMEMNVSYDWNDQTLTVEAVVEVITRESVENSEVAGYFTIPATAFEIGDWLSWIDAFDFDDHNEDDYDNSSEHTPMEFVQTLDACGLTFEGTYWASSAGLQGLLATTGYRRLPSVRLGGVDVEVISASISVRVTKVVDPQGDDSVATPEGLESGRDSYYDKYILRQV